MMVRNVSNVLRILVITVTAMLFGYQPAQALDMTGAGATFPYPIYSKWFDEYLAVDPSVRFNYQSIGSGAGINLLKNQVVDFGASDAPLSDAQAEAMPRPVLHFPTVIGAVVLAYNLPSVKQPLRLSGPVIAGIFLNKITNWSDPEIAKLNPGVNLPNLPIASCHRSDGSGTTYIFSDYLSKVSPEWGKAVGKGTSLAWPLGLGGKGNDGVTELVEQTNGAIGYIELIYALNNHIPYAVVQNHDGKWINPDIKSITATAAHASASMPSDFRVSITDAPGANVYPISSFTWLLVYREQSDRTKGQAIINFLKWALTNGQKYASPLYYAPLPQAVVTKELSAIGEISVPK